MTNGPNQSGDSYNPDKDRSYRGKGLQGIQDQINELTQRIFDLSKMENRILGLVTEDISGESLIKSDRPLVQAEPDNEETDIVTFQEPESEERERIEREDGSVIYKEGNKEFTPFNSRREGQVPSSIFGLNQHLDNIESKFDQYFSSFAGGFTGTTRDITTVLTQPEESLINFFVEEIAAIAIDSITGFLVKGGASGFLISLVASAVGSSFIGELFDSYADEGEEPFNTGEVEYQGIPELLKIMDRREDKNTSEISEIKDELKKIRQRQEAILQREPEVTVIEPTDSYEEFEIESQLEVVFTNNFPLQVGKKYRFNIPNLAVPVSQLNWEDYFKDWVINKGNVYARIVWSDSGISTGTYVISEEEAERLFQKIESLSSSSVKGKRISRNSSIDYWQGEVKAVRAVVKQPKEDQSGRQYIETTCFYPPERFTYGGEGEENEESNEENNEENNG